MQGKKKYEPKLFVNFYLPDVVPIDNFYRILKSKLDLSFVYDMTKSVYSHTGKPSIDPVVFFKMLLVGYLENCCSDRALERLFQLRLDLLLFIDHDITDRVPDHSTICKTRKRIPSEVFNAVFNHILGLCVQSGLVSGEIQSIDSAYINANASLDRMVEVKMIDRSPDEYLDEIKAQDEPTEEEKELAKKRLKKSQKTLEDFTEMRRRKYSEQDGGNKKNRRRFLSNATHLSNTDPDARIAKKSGKPRMLCYSSMMSVDSQAHVITHIAAEHSSKKDSRYLLDTVDTICSRLELLGMGVKKVLADTGFSSGENYYVLKEWGIDAYIPLHGGYKPKRESFTYDKRWDRYKCQNGAYLNYKRTSNTGGYEKKHYDSSRKDCNTCPYRDGCVNSHGIKRIAHTLYKEEYDEMAKKLKSKKGKELYQQRMHTVEPVFGTLQQYYGLRWINTRGKECANKLMLMAASALNLRKWLKNEVEKTKNGLYLLIFTLRCTIDDLLPINKIN
ncbi:MAG: IS1182 family transposase [Aureibaculum sp.]